MNNYSLLILNINSLILLYFTSYFFEGQKIENKLKINYLKKNYCLL